jgi:hypothetical protein
MGEQHLKLTYCSYEKGGSGLLPRTSLAGEAARNERGRSQREPEDSQRIEERDIEERTEWYHVYCKEHLDQFAWLHIIIPGPFPLDFL